MTLLANGILTGIPEIDEQHRELFSRIDAFFQACQEGGEHDHLREIFKFLNQYIDVHFVAEEKLQQETGYPGYADHKRQHLEYRDKLKEIEAEFEECGLNDYLLQQLNHVLIDWLLLHIGKVDHAFSVYIRKNGIEIPRAETRDESLTASPVASVAGDDVDAEIESLLRKGLHAFGLGETETATLAWRAVLDLDPSNASALDYLESAGIGVEEYRSGDHLVQRGISHFSEGNTQAAAEAWKAALDEDPDSVHARGYLEALVNDGSIDVVPLPVLVLDEPIDAASSSDSVGRPREAVDKTEIIRLLKEEKFEDVYTQLKSAFNCDPSDEVLGRSLKLVENHLTLNYMEMLGDLGQHPRLLASNEAITSLDLNSEEGYLLFLIDGEASVNEILSVSSLGHFRTSRYLARMLDQNIIDLGAG